MFVDTNFPHVSVVISTAGRGNTIVTAIKSIFTNTYPNFDLYVIDQSDDDQTKIAVQPFLQEPRFHYTQSPTKGASIGRNLGILQSNSEFIAVTDDDCEVAPDWIFQLVEAFKKDSRIGVVYGNLLAGEHDPSSGFIPFFEQKTDTYVRSFGQKGMVDLIGMGGCMGIKRQAWVEVGGFDPLMGPGAPIPAWEDQDFSLRVLLKEYFIYITPLVNVVHHGFRSWQQGRDLAKRNWFSLGAGFAKYLKCRHWPIIPFMSNLWFGVAIRDFLYSVLVKRRLSSLTPVLAFVKGFGVGFFLKVELAACLYTLKVGSISLIEADQS